MKQKYLTQKTINADELTFEEISGFSDDDDNSDEEKETEKEIH